VRYDTIAVALVQAMLFDALIFAIANAWLYAGNFRLVRYCWRFNRHLPDIANPQRYSERMLWRKLVDHNPLFVLFADKLATKEYLQRRCPELALPRTLWIGRDTDEIPDAVLAGDVFVKANHGCGFHWRIRGGHCDRAALRQVSRRWLAAVHGRTFGEWAYSQVEPKLFVEEAIGDAETDLVEFNIRASNGRAILGSVLGRCKLPDQWLVSLDVAGAPTRGTRDAEDGPIALLPPGLEIREPYLRAVRLAERISVGVDYVRVDFMWNGSELFGGEITTYPAAGLKDPANASVAALIGDGWDLRHTHFLNAPQSGWKRIYAGALRRRWSSGSPKLP
jgi:hypothetical protein